MRSIPSAFGLIAGFALASGAWAEPQRLQEFNPIATPSVRMSSSDAKDLTPIGRQKLALREEALRMQAADGGTLSPEHHAYLQRKLDRINNG